jgi:hypothetical protein
MNDSPSNAIVRASLVRGFCLVCFTAAATGIALAVDSAAPTNSPISIFNGRDLAGFHTWLVDTKSSDPRHVFTVINGAIRISGDGLGYLATESEYANYHLVAEFKWGQTNWVWGDRVGKARDSGIFLHAVGPDGNSHDGNGAFMAAIECNLFQGSTGDFLLIRGTAADGSLIAPRLTASVAAAKDADGWFTWQADGRRQSIERWGRLNWFGKDHRWQDETDYRGSRDVERPYGEWNRLECICDGDRIRVILNGVLVNECSEIYPARGRILLQCEGSEIFFRRLELRLLSAGLRQ